jgi:hypothetical protein
MAGVVYTAKAALPVNPVIAPVLHAPEWDWVPLTFDPLTLTFPPTNATIWEPGFPIRGAVGPGLPTPAAYTLSAGLPASQDVSDPVAATVTVLKAGADTADLEYHLIAVRVLVNGAVRAASKDNVTFYNYLVYLVTNYSGSSYGLSENIYADLRSTDDGKTLVLEAVLYSIYPALLATTSEALTASALHFDVQPAQWDGAYGATATFTAHATGDSPITYQWYKSGVKVTGATSASYSVASSYANDQALYTCRATANGKTVTSNAAMLNVTSISWTNQPSNWNGSGNAVFTGVCAPGTHAIYQWYKDGVALPNSGTTFPYVSGATTQSLSISATMWGSGKNDLSDFYCIATYRGMTATTNTATLNITSDALTQIGPNSGGRQQWCAPGGYPSNITFTAIGGFQLVGKQSASPSGPVFITRYRAIVNLRSSHDSSSRGTIPDLTGKTLTGASLYVSGLKVETLESIGNAKFYLSDSSDTYEPASALGLLATLLNANIPTSATQLVIPLDVSVLAANQGAYLDILVTTSVEEVGGGGGENGTKDALFYNGLSQIIFTFASI